MNTNLPDVTVTKPDQNELDGLGVFDWPVWTKENSTFDWYYDQKEICYLLEGKVKVTTENGSWEFGAGDLVTFRQGLKCSWEIYEPVRKHYTFE